MTAVTTILLTLVAIAPARADEPKKLVAILPIVSKGHVDEVDLATIIDQVRSEAARTLTPAGFLVLTEDVQLTVLRENGISAEQLLKVCESSCPLEVAQELKSNVFVTGMLSRSSEGDYVLFLRLYDGVKGVLLGATQAIEGRSIRDLRTQFGAASKAFFESAVRPVDVRFSAAVRMTMPQPFERRAVTGAIDIAAETLLDAAELETGREFVRPERKAEAWCKLAALKPAHAYTQRAQEACASWTEYAGDVQRAEILLARDYRILREYLHLTTRTKEQRIGAIDQFLTTHRQLGGRPMLRAAEDVRVAIDKGDRGVLPEYFSATDADDDGVDDGIDACPTRFGSEAACGCPSKSDVKGPIEACLKPLSPAGTQAHSFANSTYRVKFLHGFEGERWSVFNSELTRVCRAPCVRLLHPQNEMKLRLDVADVEEREIGTPEVFKVDLKTVDRTYLGRTLLVRPQYKRHFAWGKAGVVLASVTAVSGAATALTWNYTRGKMYVDDGLAFGTIAGFGLGLIASGLTGYLSGVPEPVGFSIEPEGAGGEL